MEYESLSLEQREQLAIAMYSSNKRLNFGPFILGNGIDGVLCGIFLIQCGSYINSSARDGWLLKTTVAYVVIMNLCSTGLAWAWMWHIFVQNFGIYHTLFSATYLSFALVIDTATVCVVQSFFALRAWKVLNQSRLFAVVVPILIAAPFASGLVAKILGAHYGLAKYTDDFKVAGYTGLSCMVLVDVAITSTILCYLLRWRGSCEYTKDLLTKLVRITFESQLPPTLIAIALLAVYAIRHDSFITVPLIWVQPKLYGISLLHTLNMRGSTAQSSLVIGTTFTSPSNDIGSEDMRFSIPMTGTFQTTRDAVTTQDDATRPVARSSSATLETSPKPMVVRFGGCSLTSTSAQAMRIQLIGMGGSRSLSSSTDIELGGEGLNNTPGEASS